MRKFIWILRLIPYLQQQKRMKLYIDPTGGMAGDMFAAALISAGADKPQMIAAMLQAAEKLGPASISDSLTHDAAMRLHMKVDHKHGHLSGHDAWHLLDDLFNDLNITEPYRSFGFKALKILVDAEIKAHKENTFLTDHIHAHDHDHHTEGHAHAHPKAEAFLHEAQDILIDITGAVMGLQLLNAPVKAHLLAEVSLGGGHITFSHGHLPVPAPATKNIFDTFQLPGVAGPVETELCTPTGSALLAALDATLLETEKDPIIKEGNSRGGKDLPIPPLKIMLSE